MKKITGIVAVCICISMLTYGQSSKKATLKQLQKALDSNISILIEQYRFFDIKPAATDSAGKGKSLDAPIMSGAEYLGITKIKMLVDTTIGSLNTLPDPSRFPLLDVKYRQKLKSFKVELSEFKAELEASERFAELKLERDSIPDLSEKDTICGCGKVDPLLPLGKNDSARVLKRIAMISRESDSIIKTFLTTILCCISDSLKAHQRSLYRKITDGQNQVITAHMDQLKGGYRLERMYGIYKAGLRLQAWLRREK